MDSKEVGGVKSLRGDQAAAVGERIKNARKKSPAQKRRGKGRGADRTKIVGRKQDRKPTLPKLARASGESKAEGTLLGPWNRGGKCGEGKRAKGNEKIFGKNRGRRTIRRWGIN